MGAGKKLQEVRELTPEDIKKKIEESSDELMKLRFRLAGGQLENTAQLKILRRSIAQMKTVLNEKAAVSAN